MLFPPPLQDKIKLCSSPPLQKGGEREREYDGPPSLQKGRVTEGKKSRQNKITLFPSFVKRKGKRIEYDGPPSLQKGRERE